MVERSSGVGWLAIRGAVIISWMARDRCPGWLVEQWHEIIGFVVESVVIFLEAFAWGLNNQCFSISIVFIKIDWKFESEINK